MGEEEELDDEVETQDQPDKNVVLFSDEDEEFSKVKFKKQGGQFKLMEIEVPPNMIKA